MFNKNHTNKEFKHTLKEKQLRKEKIIDNDLLEQSIKDNWYEISKHLSAEQYDEVLETMSKSDKERGMR